MNRHHHVALVCLILTPIVCLAGCVTLANVAMASDNLDVSAKTFTPPEGQANVYIARAPGFMGGAIVFTVIVDGKVIGSIGQGTYFLVSLAPGNHNLAVTSNENSVNAKLTAAADTNYFFEVSPTAGVATARAAIALKEEAQGKELVRSCKRAEGLLDQ